MYLQKLHLLNFRNYDELSLTFPPSGALFEGLNGAGKTNILESVHLLCTGRSQRGAGRSDMISHKHESAFIEGEFYPTTTAAIGFSRGKKVIMKRDGFEVGSFSEWFGERPVVSFGADDLNLVYGPPEARRNFLDMLLCQTDRAYLDALLLYRKNMRCRNALFGKTYDAAQFEVYEQAMAVSASMLVSSRLEAVTELCVPLSEFYAEISRNSESVRLEYASKIKHNLSDFNTVEEWQNIYLNTLTEYRRRDAELMFTSYGPHRDELRFFMNGMPVKTYASQGQCRSFALSLKLGAVMFLTRRRGDSMIFLIDDAVSELDSERTSRAYPLLEGRGQIFIATPRCFAKLGDDVLRYTVENGKAVVS